MLRGADRSCRSAPQVCRRTGDSLLDHYTLTGLEFVVRPPPGSWTKARQWETERTLFSSARATMCPLAKVNSVWPFNDAWLRTSLYSRAHHPTPEPAA